MSGERKRLHSRAIRSGFNTPLTRIVRLAVETLAPDYDLLKVYNGLSVEAYAGLADAAQRLHVRLVGHIPRAPGWQGVLAAQVATGLGPLAEGSDGGGSVRIPAACCGVVGLKPSRGRVSLAPVAGEIWGGLFTNGPITRSVHDAALMLDVLRSLEISVPQG